MSQCLSFAFFNSILKSSGGSIKQYYPQTHLPFMPGLTPNMMFKLSYTITITQESLNHHNYFVFS
jgi:hypothetical protein